MKSIASLLILCLTHVVSAQRMLPVDTAVVTNHQLTVKGNNFPYKATTGTQPGWDKTGEAAAYLHFTYYERTDIKNKSNRPLFISFNG